MSYSINDKTNESMSVLLNTKKITSNKGISLRASKEYILSRKLPNLTVEGKEECVVSEFHAFNFKARKKGHSVRKRK